MPVVGLDDLAAQAPWPGAPSACARPAPTAVSGAGSRTVGTGCPIQHQRAAVPERPGLLEQRDPPAAASRAGSRAAALGREQHAGRAGAQLLQHRLGLRAALREDQDRAARPRAPPWWPRTAPRCGRDRCPPPGAGARAAPPAGAGTARSAGAGRAARWPACAAGRGSDGDQQHRVDHRVVVVGGHDQRPRRPGTLLERRRPRCAGRRADSSRRTSPRTRPYPERRGLFCMLCGDSSPAGLAGRAEPR